LNLLGFLDYHANDEPRATLLRSVANREALANPHIFTPLVPTLPILRIAHAFRRSPMPMDFKENRHSPHNPFHEESS
jgi:hypothetical protein